MRSGRQEEARIQFEKAVEVESDPALKAYQTGIMLTHVYSGNPDKWGEARAHFVEALRLQPGMREAQDWLDLIDQAFDQAAGAEK
jgi:hypothetical protein